MRKNSMFHRQMLTYEYNLTLGPNFRSEKKESKDGD